MATGVLDLPGPLFAWLDAQAGGVAPGVRLVLWGALAATVSMLLYGAVSAQERIRLGRVQIAEAKRDLDRFDGEWEHAMPLVCRLLRLAFTQVGRVGWPSIVASLPLLSLLAWLSSTYAYDFPAHGTVPAVHAEPAGTLRAQWVAGACRPDGQHDCPPGRGPRILVFDGARRIAEVPLAAPVPVVHKRQWWNVFLHNPAGYLPADAPFDALRIDLPAREYLPFGPRWSRMWATLFFASLILVSLGLKRGLRLV